MFSNLLIFRWGRQLKTWVESFSERSNARTALWIFAFIEAVFFPIPPDVLLIAMAFSVPSRSFQFTWICTFGSLTGAVAGYGVGYLSSDLGKALINFFDPSEHAVSKIDALFSAYGFWGIVAAAITPIPFKVFIVASGLFKYDFSTFLAAVAIGRPIRFLAVSALFFFFGQKIKPFVDKHFEWLSVIFLLLLVGGFYLLKFLK